MSMILLITIDIITCDSEDSERNVVLGTFNLTSSNIFKTIYYNL